MQIKPLVQAKIRVPLSVVFFSGSSEYIASGPVYIWLIDAGEKIVVDAGVAENAMYPVEGGGEKGVINALEQEKLSPEDVETLVITHLHFDHCANAHLFHNARVYVQKREWEFAMNPLPVLRDLYVEKYLETLESMDLCLVKGDLEIADGVKPVALPGHTPGLQGILVKTKSGKYLMASDHFYSYMNIFPPKQNIEIQNEHGKAVIPAQKSPFFPIGLYVSLQDWFESCYKAASIVKKSRIIPGHDPSLEGRSFE
ncbi:MAG: N-acyl homoserine lactonase family protein [Archaeoglobaceae archaeon]